MIVKDIYGRHCLFHSYVDEKHPALVKFYIRVVFHCDDIWNSIDLCDEEVVECGRYYDSNGKRR